MKSNAVHRIVWLLAVFACDHEGEVPARRVTAAALAGSLDARGADLPTVRAPARDPDRVRPIAAESAVRARAQALLAHAASAGFGALARPEPVSLEASGLASIVAEPPSRGEPSAPITVVEFCDFQCGFCRRAEPTARRLVDDNPGRVRLVYRDLPLAGHAWAAGAAEAALCAGAQGRYWDLHDRLFSADALDPDSVRGYARALGLDLAAFDRCVASGAKALDVEVSREIAAESSIHATPTFVIGDRVAAGALPYETLQQLVDAAAASR